MLAALAAGADGRPQARMLLSKALTVGEELVATLRDHPSALRVELAGSARRLADTVQGPRHRRGLERPGGARGGVRRAALDRLRVDLGRGRRQGDHPLGPAGGPQDRAGGGLRQPAPALHGLREAQRGDAHRGGAARPARERVRDRRRRERRVRGLRDRGGGLRAARDAVHPARAAREPRRARGRARGPAPEARSSWTTSAATCTAHHPLRRPRERRGDGERRARARLRLRGDHRPLGHARLRERRAGRRVAAPLRGDPLAAGPGDHRARGH